MQKRRAHRQPTFYRDGDAKERQTLYEQVFGTKNASAHKTFFSKIRFHGFWRNADR